VSESKVTVTWEVADNVIEVAIPGYAYKQLGLLEAFKVFLDLAECLEKATDAADPAALQPEWAEFMALAEKAGLL
jgi:hypothetical protein